MANHPAPPRPTVALLIIDMQNDYVHRNGATLRYFRATDAGRPIATSHEPSAAEQIVPMVIRLVTAARAAHIPIIWIRTILDATTVSPRAAAQGKRFVWADDPWGTAFYDGLHPNTDEAIITKRRHSAFFGTDLTLILNRLRAETLILTGVSTPYCVEGTARDAFAHDYQVITVADGTASKVTAEHTDALSRLGRVFGTVVDGADLLAQWTEAAVATMENVYG